MNKLYPSYNAIASESMYSTPSQNISHKSGSASFSQPREFINFSEICDDLQEYFYLDGNGLDHPRRKTE